MSDDPEIVFKGKLLNVVWNPTTHCFKVVFSEYSLDVERFNYGFFTSVKSAKQKAIKYVIEIERDAL